MSGSGAEVSGKSSMRLRIFSKKVQVPSLGFQKKLDAVAELSKKRADRLLRI